MTIDIKDIQGRIRATVPVQEGAVGVFSLMNADYIQLAFSSRYVIPFRLGDYADLSGIEFEGLGGKIAKVYEVVDMNNVNPTYNESTGAYDYTLRLDAYYWKWKNKIFKYTPENAGQEASWSLTATLDVHLGVFLRNLKALGYRYNNQDFTFDIDSTVENKAVAVTYDNMNMLDALFMLAGKDYYNCDCWVTDNVIHFGRNEFGDAVTIERGVEAVSVGKAESKGTYATRIYAFGGTRNIPTNYRPSDEQAVVNGVVQKRLMLPAGTPYIDAYPGMTTEEAIEDVVVFDDIFPRRVGTMSDVTTVDRDIMEGDTVVGTFKAYQYKDAGLVFKEEYIIPGQELRITFQSGKMNGMEFSVQFNPNGEELAEQLWEIVRNEDYGRPLPDDTLFPENGDTYVLTGFDIQLVSDQYVPQAEQELLERAQKYAEQAKKDDGTYPVTLFSDFVYEDQLRHNYEFGQRVNLIDRAYFPDGRVSRILGWEIKLDIPFDSPQYTIGESMPYSRIGELEEKVDSLTYKGQTYTGGGGGVYVIKTNDSTAPSDSNVFSAKRSLATLLRKDKADTMPYLLSLLKGAVFGKNGFAEGLTGFGAKIDENGNGEMRRLRLWEALEVPELRYNRVDVVIGDKWRSAGAGIIESCTPDTDAEGNVLDTGTCTLKLESGEIGAVSVDDIAMGIWHFGDERDATQDSDDGIGNFTFAGFATAYWRITEVIGDNNGSFKYALRPGYDIHPHPQMTFSCRGNFTKPSRQTSVYETRTYTRMLINQNTWEFGKQNIGLQYGDLSNLNVFGLDMKGYSMYLNSVYFTGVIKQVKPDGTPIVTANDRGAWKQGVKYDYYDRVSHNGSLWLCVNEQGTQTEPSTKNADWLLEVSLDTYHIMPSTTSIHVDKDGVYSPEKLYCDVVKKGTGGYEDLLVLPEGLVLKFTYDGRPENIWSGSLQLNTSSVKSIITFNLYYNTAVIDKVDIFVLKDGQDGSDGQDGTDGVSPVIYSLFASDNVIQVSGESHTPSTVSCRIKKVVGEGVTIEDTIPAGYSMKYKKDDNAQQAYTINTPVDTSDAVNSISFYLYKGDVYIDAVRIAVVKDGDVAMAGASPRYRGFWNKDKQYVYTDEDRDIVIFGDSKYRVKNKGQVPIGTEPTNTTYWEEASEFEFIAMDTALIDNANIAGFIFRKLGELSDGTPYGELKSQNNDTDGAPMLSMNTRTGKFICRDAVIKGEVNATSGTFTDVIINGSLRSEFDKIEDSVDSDYSDNVIVDTPAGWPTVYSLPLGANHIGRKLTICAIGEGISSFTIPDSNSYYFYEFGKKKKEMNLHREVAQLIGYGLGGEFYGWIVLSRNYLDVPFGNGDYDKVLAKGYASMRNSLRKYSTYDGSTLKITQGSNKVSFEMPTTWFKSFEEYVIFITPRSSAAAGTYLVSPINNYQFEVTYLGSGGGGAFYFEIKRLNF